eukprot:CAMPEP_0201880040 /NCGR_PEP_ID=MMETSP0902-20130614/10759_1 /ASSEMBLY_ACC=CAM_ASM_000551 /TAXON_ID=420261 /ORGANISM="Thalassiosira antarctica, Strain CCMP982" /LENGTH=193 /DNA_ID=CAMNT_0048408001 /DNA_START=87 /DNA_END=668 /DNA_ORIENTATION=+
MATQYGSLHTTDQETMLRVEDADDVERRIFSSRLDERNISSDLMFASSSRTMKMVKVFAISCFLVASLKYTAGWITPTNTSISAILTTAPPLTADFTGSYADPNHVNCRRHIQVVFGTSGQAEVSGTDGTPGCPADGSGDAWNLLGQVDGDTLLVDFSPKGGPVDLKGVWEAAPVPGIRWPDGNLWSVATVTQ